MLEQIQEIYNAVAGREDLILTPETKIAKLELSSLGLIHLICQIEDTYDIEVTNQALERFKKVKDVLEYLEKKIG